MGGQKGPDRGKITQHVQHIQHFSRKKHFFGKGIQHDLTYSTCQQKDALKKELVSGEKIQHGPKSGFFSRKMLKMAFNNLTTLPF